jgi:hypothetical protein
MIESSDGWKAVASNIEHGILSDGIASGMMTSPFSRSSWMGTEYRKTRIEQMQNRKEMTFGKALIAFLLIFSVDHVHDNNSTFSHVIVFTRIPRFLGISREHQGH